MDPEITKFMGKVVFASIVLAMLIAGYFWTIG